MKRINIAISILFLSITISAQNELELRPDGIVVPRTDTSSVIGPVEGMMIYDTTFNNYLYNDGQRWRSQNLAPNQLTTLPKDLVHLGSITDDGTTALEEPRSIFVLGQYAYVTATLDDGVAILDISDPSDPVHVGSIFNDLTTILNGATGIYVAGKYAYITASAENGVEILDVSDPTNPKHVGSIQDNATTALDGAWGIQVQGNYAYVASVNDNGIEILDISDPTSPAHVSSIFDNATIALDGAIDIYVSGNFAYVASFRDHGVAIIDISDPTDPTHVSSFFDNSNTALNGAIGIYVSGQYAYVCGTGEDGIEILDISDPFNPVHVGKIFDDATTALDGPLNIQVSGKYAYVTSFTEDGVEVLDISDPTNPTHVSSITDDASILLDGARDIFISGQYAYVTSRYDNGVEILDIGGSSIHAAEIGTINSNRLDVDESVIIGDELSVGGGLQVGASTLIQGSLNLSNELINEPGGIELANIRPGIVYKSHFYQDNSGNLIIRKGSSANHLVLVGGRAGISRIPTSNHLEVQGSASKTTAGSWLANSDRRIKTDIREIENATDILSQLRPVKFKYSEQWKQIKPSIKDQYYYNFIAQEFQEVFPEAVKGSGEYLKNDEDEILQIDTYNAQIVTIAAVQELIKENQELREQLSDFKNDNKLNKEVLTVQNAKIKSIADQLNQLLLMVGSN